MSARPSVRKTKPQAHTQVCCACDGGGLTEDADWDEDGRIYKCSVKCEGCDGTGYLVDCSRCDEPMPLSAALYTGGLCPACVAGLERGDQESEMARIRRWRVA